MKAILIVDMDDESQTVHIGEENGSGCIYSMKTNQDVADAVLDYLTTIAEYDK